MKSIGRNDPCPCGSGRKFKLCCIGKVKTQATPQSSRQLNLSEQFKQAVQCQQQGRLEHATYICEQILAAVGDHPDTLHLIGLLSHQRGNNDKAISFIRRAIHANPTEPLYHGNLALLFKLSGRIDDAVACYRQEILLKPDWAEAHNNLGSALRAQGRLNDAAQSYLRAIELEPELAEAYSNLGNVYLAQGNKSKALQYYVKALEINPCYSEAYSNIGKVYLDLNDIEAAESYLRKAVEVNPELRIAQSNLGKILLLQGKLTEAAAAYQCVERGTASSSILVKYAFQLPAIMGTHAEVLRSRTRLERNIDVLADVVSIADPLEQGCSSNFYLAFHGQNDKAIQKRIADFYVKICPSLVYIAPHCTMPRAFGPKSKIGFISKFIYTHSVSLSFGQIVQKMKEHSDFEVTLISSHDNRQVRSDNMYRDFTGLHLHLSDSLAEARSQIAELELDVLVYLDIGMEPLGYFLAYARLAPVQCVLGGHPVTTGIGNIDYYLSSDLAEPENADNHYTEELIRLPFGAFYFERPMLPPICKTRAQLGMPEGVRVYVCPMTLQKIHPDFDEAVARILELDPEGQVVFFEDRSVKEWRVLLEKRFRQTINHALHDRILFLPWFVDAADFSSAIANSDVVLDSFHFGIGTTAITTCSVGTPFVTKPGAFLRGRVGLFYCKVLGVMECVVNSTEEYAHRAIKIASQPDFRAHLKARILANNHKLFENHQGISDVVDFFGELKHRKVSHERS